MTQVKDQPKLTATRRTQAGRRMRASKSAAEIPAVLYGHNLKESQPLAVNRAAAERIYQTAGESSLVELNLAGSETFPVLIQEIQRNPVTGSLQHLDFYRVNMAEKVSTAVPLVFAGESAAVKALGGTLVRTMDHINITCLPSDLVHEITVDLAPLTSFDSTLHVKDIPLPNGIALDGYTGDETIALVEAPMTEAEIAALDAKVDEQAAVASVEVEKPVKEGEEPAEEEAAEAKK